MPVGDGDHDFEQADDFEAWLAELAPTGYAVSFVPWWYGGSGGYDPRSGSGWSGGGSRYHGSSDRNGSGYRTAGYDRRSASAEGADDAADEADDDFGTGSGSGWLRLAGGLVRVDCDGSQLLDWSATPWDGWDVRGRRHRGVVQVRFRSERTTVDVQAGCAGDRPAFRYREGDDGEWLTSVT